MQTVSAVAAPAVSGASVAGAGSTGVENRPWVGSRTTDLSYGEPSWVPGEQKDGGGTRRDGSWSWMEGAGSVVRPSVVTLGVPRV